MLPKRGHCLCGEVRFEYSGHETWCGHCHCESCRRNTSSPFTTWFGVPKNALRFTGKPPSVYRSSPGARRMFCSNCGTPMAYESDKYPDEIHLYLSSLEDPEILIPQFHVHCAEKHSWIVISDDLPQYKHHGP
jgi:hypothetical protein